MVTIYPLAYSKAQLEHVPPAEHLFQLLLAHVSNEIIILRKQMTFGVVSVEGVKPVVDAAGLAVTHLNLRLLAGALHEAHGLINSKAGRAGLADLLELMPAESREARRAFNKMFGKSNPISWVRNKAAYHIDLALCEATFQSIPGAEDLIDYLSVESGNCIYQSGVVLGAFQLAEALPAATGTLGERLDELHDIISETAHQFEAFAQGYMLAFYERHCGVDAEALEEVAFELSDCPPIEKTKLHYHLDSDSFRATLIDEE